MKHFIIPALFSILLISCNSPEEQVSQKEETGVNYVLISGKIKNSQNDSIVIANNYTANFKKLTVNSNGEFKDTLFVNDSISTYYFQHGQQYAPMFLKKGYKLEIALDYNDFDNSLTYKGEGSAENKLILDLLVMNSSEDLYSLLEESDDQIYKEKVSAHQNKVINLLEGAKDIDTSLISLQKENLENLLGELEYYRTSALAEKKVFDALKGSPSPVFSNYETRDGKKKSLNDFLGKYIYIDIWATWCGPCLAETPHLKSIYNDYKDEKLTVLSISVDKENAKETWKNMIVEEGLEWDNIIADNNFSSDFIQAYSINSIPRFILIDPAGNVVEASAPRPSSKEIRVLLDSLLKQ